MNMLKAQIFLVSDDATLGESMGSVLAKLPNCKLTTISHCDEPLKMLQSQDVDLLIFHSVGPNGHPTACSMLQQIAYEKRFLPMLVVSEEHDPSQALQVLRSGAADWLSRPLDLRRMAFLIDSLTLRLMFRAAPRQEACVSDGGLDSHELFGCSNSQTSAVSKRLQKIACHDITVLLTGETGVGKTRMARMIHEMSARREEPFLVVNCAALPEQLLESELFGHRKGAFTGADIERIGKFAAAGCGTLLLDEVDSLSLASQAKLLRVVDERVFEQVGSNKSIQCKARLVVATNRNLEMEADAGRFRSDLYYRFNAASFNLPSLRERPAAIALIAEGFIEEFATHAKMVVPHISSEAMGVMQDYAWPGNVRELRNAMERAVALCVGDVIEVADLPENMTASQTEVHNVRFDQSHFEVVPMAAESWPSPIVSKASLENDLGPAIVALSAAVPETAVCITSFGSKVSELAMARAKGEMARVIEALDRCSNNRSRAAQELGISRTALYKKLQKYGMSS